MPVKATLLKKFLTPAIILLFAVSVFAQKQNIAFVDTEYILEQMTDYRSAQKQIDDLAEGWKKDMEKQQDEIDKLNKNYQAEWVLLPEESRKKREEDIKEKEKSLSTFRKEKFGADGELFKKRQALLKPIQDKVYQAVNDVCKENQIDFMFDRAGAVTMLIANAKYDRSDEVLEKLGLAKTGDNKQQKTEDKKDDNPLKNILKKNENPLNNLINKQEPEKK